MLCLVFAKMNCAKCYKPLLQPIKVCFTGGSDLFKANLLDTPLFFQRPLWSTAFVRLSSDTFITFSHMRASDDSL